MSKIISNLYVASVEETFKNEDLKVCVTHFLNVASEVLISERVNHVYKKIAIPDDDDNSDIRIIIEPCLEWIHTALENGGSVCVHCLEGKSRSVCICIAYMCYYMNMTYEQAYTTIYDKRPCIDIFPLYESQVKEWLETWLLEHQLDTSK